MITAFVTALTLISALPQQATPQPERVSISGPEPALIKLGESSRITIVVSGTSGNPRDFRMPKTSSATFQLSNGGTQSGRVYDNGRLRVYHTKTLYIDITPRQAGKIRVPAITFNSGSKVHTVPSKTIEVRKDISAADRGVLRVIPSVKSAYVNEPIRFRFEVEIDNRLTLEQGQTDRGERYINVSIQAPWLEAMDGTVSIEDPEIDNPVSIVLNGHVLLASKYGEVDRSGARYNRFSFVKSFQGTQPGRLDLVAPFVRFTTEGKLSRQRGIFGQRVRTQSKPMFLYAEPISIEVKPLPTDGRPASYTNGVGRFELSAALNKKTVKVGNSIQLTLTIAGQGNTEFLDPPELETIPGFHLLGKKINRETDAVRVTYDLTPLEESTTEVPAITWSFFDTSPGVERYIEKKTSPISIRVVALAEGGGLSTLSGEDAGSVVAGVDDIFDMLPIDADSLVLPSRPGIGLTAMILFAPWFLCLALFGLLGSYRRRSADVLGQRAKGAAKNFERVYSENGDAAEALAAYLGDRLGVAAAAVIGADLEARLRDVGVDAKLASELQSAIDVGTASRYGGGGGLSKDDATCLMKRMHGVQIDMKKIARGIAGLLVLLSLSAGLCAQDAAPTVRAAVPVSAPTVQGAEAAYRDGDYKLAAKGFRAASELPGADRRLFYNLGNSLYRQGRFADALVAYRCAQLGMPRDSELARNIVLVRKKLDLGSAEGESFLTSLARLRDQLTPLELLWLCVACHLFAAISLVFGRRVWRVLGFVALAHALLFTVELLVLGPARPAAAIVTAERVEVTAEPRTGLEAVFKLREGVAVAVLGETPLWTRVRVEGREGYVPTGSLGFVR